MEHKAVKMTLCEARHSIPEAVDGSVFPSVLDPLDLEGMAAIAVDTLRGVTALDLYVTGLSVALVEVINYCHKNGVSLTLWHYNRDSGGYYPQRVD